MPADVVCIIKMTEKSSFLCKSSLIAYDQLQAQKGQKKVWKQSPLFKSVSADSDQPNTNIALCQFFIIEFFSSLFSSSKYKPLKNDQGDGLSLSFDSS